MKLYKSPKGDVWAYESDGSQDNLIPSNFVALTKEEIMAREAKFAADAQAAKNAKASALAKLTALGLTADEITALLGNAQ
jgi:hypothetical protein